MFMLTKGPGTVLAFPDVCRTPPVGAAVPYPNIVRTPTTSQTADQVIVEGAPALHQLSEGQVSSGNTAGRFKGVVSGEVGGRCLFLGGCSSVLVDGAPAQRVSSVSAQNASGMQPNAQGMAVGPSQTTVLTLG